MNFVFVMDPLSTVVMEKDTSFILMLGAYRRGHAVYFVGDGGILLKDGGLQFHAVPVVPQLDPQKPFIEKKKELLTPQTIDCVFIRSDPPFDYQYLVNTWLLDRLPRHIPVINSPSGIRTVNEKIWATRFPEITPRTLIGQRREDLFSFLAEEKDIVVKPTDGFGGSSVFRVRVEDKNAKVILETATHRFSRDVILQRYVPESEKGDKRILLLDGEVLGAVLRVHAPDDHRNNFFAGGKPFPAEINAEDREIVSTLKPELQRLGLVFVGIDVIGGRLIEVNVTSPTGLQEMNRLYQKTLEDQVIDFAEKLVESTCN